MEPPISVSGVLGGMGIYRLPSFYFICPLLAVDFSSCKAFLLTSWLVTRTELSTSAVP